MVRENLKTVSSTKSKIFGYMLINIIPIGGIVALVWGLNQGKISLDDLPGGLGRNALYFAVSVALLILCASLLLPVTHRLAGHFKARLGWSGELRSHGGVGRKMWEGLLWLPRQLGFRVSALLRFVFILASVILIACSVIFIIRFLNPELLEEELQISMRMLDLEQAIRSFQWRWPW